MKFESDEAKRIATIEKHGLDFLGAELLFGAPHLIGPANMVGGEQRWPAVGMIEDLHVTAIFTCRGTAVRLISLRKARANERKQHQTLFSR